MSFFIVGVGGLLGSISRYSIYLLEKKFQVGFPLGTLVINTLGCVIAGFILGVGPKLLPENRQLLNLASVGFVGAFTTFSTFSAETFQLLRMNQALLAILNIVVSIFLGLLAVWAGFKTSELF